MMKRLPILLFALLIAPWAAVQGADFFVASSGNDTDPGTELKPFATLERAQTAVRQLKKHTQGVPRGGINVFLRGGIYHRSTAWVLTDEDSGTSEAPVVYRAYPGERVSLIGGVTIPLADFSLVDDERILRRLPDGAQGKVLSVNLKSKGINDYGALSLFGASVLPPYTPGPVAPELFIDGKAMTVARWPNSEYAIVDSVIEVGSNLRMWQPDMVGRDDRRGKYVPPEQRENPPKGFSFTVASDRPSRWTTAEDAWMFGYWYWDWSNQSVKIQSIDSETRVIHSAHASGYGIRTGQRFFAYNLLEELDAPDEWYLDRTSGVLYLYPSKEDRIGTATLSLRTEPLVQMQNTSHVVLSDLALGMTRGNAVNINNGEGIVIERCDIGNLGGKAVVVNDGRLHTIRNCLVHDTGAGGISLGGGDRATLSPAGHLVEKCEITRFTRLQKAYAEGITLTGVGNRAAHNLIHDAAHAAIHFEGNDHIIEFNEIHHVLLESDDAGAIYSGRRLTFWGNKIRHNYFHDIYGLPPSQVRFKRVLAHAIFLDDALSGIEITGNVFQRCNDAISIKGSDNRFENNLVIDCRKAVSDDSRKPGGTHPIPLRFDQVDQLPKNLDLTLLNDILSVPYTSDLWRQRYPGLATSLEQTYGAWRVRIRRNVLCRTPDIETTDWLREHGEIEENQTLNDSDLPQALSDLGAWIAKIPSRVAGFQPIPFEQIGLHDKGDRQPDTAPK